MLKVRTQKLGEVVVLCLQGRIVTGDTKILRKTVLSFTEAEAIVLDFARVSGIDAHGLGVLLDLRQQLQVKGIEFRLMNVTRLVRQVLAITKLDTVFEFTTEAETVNAKSSDRRQDSGEFALAPVD